MEEEPYKSLRPSSWQTFKWIFFGLTHDLGSVSKFDVSLSNPNVNNRVQYFAAILAKSDFIADTLNQTVVKTPVGPPRERIT